MEGLDFFIVGAAKAGTTSLYDVLDRHPEVFLSPIKEPNYFSTDIQVEQFCKAYRNNTFLDLEHYFSQSPLPPIQLSFVRNPEQYKQLFEGANEHQIKGECSTSYLYSMEAAKNIAQHSPKAKIIICLRDPISRCLSHYRMAMKYGHVKENFLEAIQSDLKRKKKGWGQSELFIELGQYTDQIKRFQNHFPAEQLHVMFFEDLIQSPTTSLKELFDFLGIASHPIPLENKNAGQSPRWSKLNYFITQTGLKKRLLDWLPQAWIEGLKKNYYSAEGLKLQADERAFLLPFYDAEYHELPELIQRELPWKN